MARAIFVTLVALFGALTVRGATITVKNQCEYGVKAFARHGDSQTNSYQLDAKTGFQTLDVGSSFLAGLVFGSASGNADNAQATQIEFTVGGANNLDYYDISLVNAYNLPVQIVPSSSSCHAPKCSISDLQSFCQAPNTYSQGSCTNTAGPGLVATASTQAFKTVCEDAYSYSKDDSSSTWTCQTGTANYDVVFCPYTTSQQEHLQYYGSA